MKIIQPSYKIETTIDPEKIYSNLERIARTCYKSESKGNAKEFISSIVKRGHEAMIEHEYITVRFIHNRGFTHELVRHRIANYAQESTRYCNYSQDKFNNELTFIVPYWLLAPQDQIWKDCMVNIENTYMKLLSEDVPSQAARGVLPNDIKTEIVITANLREWRNIFKLRCADSAHPDMKRVMIPLKNDLVWILPEIFGVN